MKYKKAQLTMFIIIGLIIVSILILTFYLFSNVSQKRMKEGIKKTESTPLEIKPIENYITSCLDKITKEALELIGKQGGYIYKTQGGTLRDYSSDKEGDSFINYNDHRVSYGIYPLRFRVGNYFSTPPNYPWDIFPYTNNSLTSKNFKGYFGTSNLPPLNEAQGAHSINKQIKTYVENNLKGCTKFEGIVGFEGYGIKQGNVKAFVIIGKEDLSAQIEFPVEITNQKTGEKTIITEFYTKPDIRISKIYSFVKNLIDNDLKDISFDIDAASNNFDFMSVRAIRDEFEKDDIIIITDEKSQMKGEPYEFIFARHNRNPALFYFDTLPNPLPVLPNLAWVYPTRVEESDGTLYSNNKVVPLHPITSNSASDPDEDALEIYYGCSNSDDTCNLQTDNCDDFRCKLNRDPTYFIVKVTDGELTDYREIPIQRS